LEPRLEDVPRLEYLAVPAGKALFVHRDYVAQLVAPLLGFQQVVQGRHRLDLGLLVTGLLEGDDGRMLGGFGVKDQADWTRFHVELGHG